jgi:4-hydroxy-3-methylbut-2-enyl diphosphate reductase
LILIGHADPSGGGRNHGAGSRPIFLVEDADGAKALQLPADEPLAYITQTTLSVDDTKAIIAVLKRKFTNILGPDTRDICYAT